MRSRPVLFLRTPPHCLKKKATLARRHSRKMDSTHSFRIGKLIFCLPGTYASARVARLGDVPGYYRSSLAGLEHGWVHSDPYWSAGITVRVFCAAPLGLRCSHCLTRPSRPGLPLFAPLGRSFPRQLARTELSQRPDLRFSAQPNTHCPAY